jgi:mono/diheme cytochrome c family protein
VVDGTQGGDGQGGPVSIQIMIMVETPEPSEADATPAAEATPTDQAADEATDEAQATGEAQATPTATEGEGETQPSDSTQEEQGEEPTPAAGVEQGGEESSPSSDEPETTESQQDESPNEASGEQQGSGNDQQLINQGGNVYMAYCAACHQEGGEGVEGIYPALAGSPFVTAEDPSQVLQVVLIGRGGMPHFQQYLTTDELAAVVSYVRNGWGNNASAVSPEQVSAMAEQSGSSPESGE